MIDLEHPFFFLEPLFSERGAVFHFSRYVYTPDSLFDEREFLDVSGSDLTVEWLEDAVRELKVDQELAIHSNVTIDNRTWHIPMIDFAADRLATHKLDRVRAFLPPRVFTSMAFFYSGRSFHAYSSTLLSPKDWLGFLGRLLLINPKDGETIVDSRWVGHRLIAGYCSLRFSNNSHHYLGVPKKVGIRGLLESRTGSPVEALDSPRNH